jgi:lambda repressor-like predicted transcriptional regulator
MNAIVPVPTPDDAISVKEARISKRLKKVLTLLATKGMTQREAAKQGGMTEAYLSTALRKPQIQVFIARTIRQTVAIGALRASTRLVELIDAGSEHVSADVSKHTLAIAGIKPSADAQVSVNIDIKAGYVIDLTEEAKRAPMIDVTHD